MEFSIFVSRKEKDRILYHIPSVLVWSFTDNLTDSDTVHWGGFSLASHGLIDIDNTQTYRFLGTLPSNVTALIQKKVIVQPWRTIYNDLIAE